MSTPTLRRCSLLLTLLLLASAAQAQWKWRDPSGNVQYSDRPPPLGTPDKDILQRPQTREIVVVRPLGFSAAASAAAPGDAASAPPRTAESDAAALKREQQQIASAKEAERRNAAQRSENCKNARSQMQLLESGVRVTRTNEKGENIVLNEAQRAEEQQRARTVAANDCR